MTESIPLSSKDYGNKTYETNDTQEMVIWSESCMVSRNSIRFEIGSPESPDGHSRLSGLSDYSSKRYSLLYSVLMSTVSHTHLTVGEGDHQLSEMISDF